VKYARADVSWVRGSGGEPSRCCATLARMSEELKLARGDGGDLVPQLQRATRSSEIRPEDALPHLQMERAENLNKTHFWKIGGSTP